MIQPKRPSGSRPWRTGYTILKSCASSKGSGAPQRVLTKGMTISLATEKDHFGYSNDENGKKKWSGTEFWASFLSYSNKMEQPTKTNGVPDLANCLLKQKTTQNPRHLSDSR